MVPFQDNYIIYQGATFNQTYQLFDPFDVPFNLAGYTARIQCRPTVTSEVILFELTTENGGINIEPSQGLISVDMLDSATAALDFTEVAAYDMELYHSDITERFVFGNVTLDLGVTR